MKNVYQKHSDILEQQHKYALDDDNFLDHNNIPLMITMHHKKKMKNLSKQNKIMQDEMIELKKHTHTKITR